MGRPKGRVTPPMVDGVSPSCAALPPGDWPTVLDFMAERFPKVERADWQERMERGEVLDGACQPIAPGAPYRSGGILYYYRRLARETLIPFEESVLYQDDWLVVADKPHFLPVLPSGRYVQQTLLVRLKQKLGIATLVPMHRIDRETAGLVLFTVRPETRDAYQALFRDRQVEKTYEAVAPWRSELALPLDYSSRLVESEAFMQMREEAGEPNAHTRISLIERRGELARYRLEPLTGQKHQLRAQMAALGMPIAGDRIYPRLLPEDAPGQEDFSHPLQLLARTVSFLDPFSGQRRQFESRLRLHL